MKKQIKKRGVAFVEMAIVLPFLVYLLFTMLFLGVSVYDSNSLESIVRQSVRYGSVQMATEAVLDEEKKYIMQPVNRQTVEDKLTKYIEKQCAEKLVFYKYESSEIEYTPSPAEWEESPNENISVKITIKRDEDFSDTDLFNVIPETMTRKLVMRIEDHSVTVTN